MLLSKLDESLDKTLGPDWHFMELETISLELGARFDELSVVQIIMLKALQEHPDLVLGDADYFLRFVEVANGNAPDAHYADIPTSLELAFAFQEAWKILGKESVPQNDMLREVTGYVLDNEGHGEAFHTCLSEYSGRPLAKNERTKAGDLYIRAMYKTGGTA